MKLTHPVVAVGFLFAVGACGGSERDFSDPTPDAATDIVAIDQRPADISSDSAVSDARVDVAPIDTPSTDVRADNRVDAAPDAPFADTSSDTWVGDGSRDAPSLDVAVDVAIDAGADDGASDAPDAVWDAPEDVMADVAIDAVDDASDGDGWTSNTLTVALAGNGAGTVTSSPAGISCGSTCSAEFPDAGSVTLTAAPTAGSNFTGWSGGGCSGTGSCVVSVMGATAVTATFTLQQFAVAVAKSGNGAGTVTSSPAGINCGSTCSANFNYAESVTITPVASTGSTFSGWSGASCPGLGACTLSVTAAVNVTATFSLLNYNLSVGKSGAAGTVTSSPSGINCGATCTSSYPYGTNVSLFANPGANAFAGWSGACSGMGSCSVAMTSARSVTASFVVPRSCTTVSTASSCTQGSVPEINLGPLTYTACHDQCQVQLAIAGISPGCWVLAGNGNCYCRSGVLNTGGSNWGGSCN